MAWNGDYRYESSDISRYGEDAKIHPDEENGAVIRLGLHRFLYKEVKLLAGNHFQQL